MKTKDTRNPDIVKDMDLTDIKALCSDIRGHIIKEVSENGGYLSGNLSCVEIAVALRKCFSKDDRIIYSGPECNYADRYLNGLDILNNENCNSLTNAFGLCVSRDIQHKDNNIVAIVNSDTVLSSSNIEALNHIGNNKRKMIIVFNDDTSIDKGIGLVDKFVSDLRRTKTYNTIKDNVKDFIRPQKGGEKIIEGIHNFKSNIKRNVIDEGVFGENNIDYIGPVDGHNIKELISAFEIAKTKDYPCVVHCITTKGKGYVYAESNTNEAFLKTIPFDIKTGKKCIEETDDYKSCCSIVSDYLLTTMSKNKDLVIVCSDNKNEASLNKLFAKYPDRCFDFGSSINNVLGFACGFSLDGKIPFVSINSSKLAEGYNELINQIDSLNKTLIIGLIGDNDNDLKILKSLDNCIIANASNSSNLLSLLQSAISENKPFIIRYPQSCIKIVKNEEISKIDIGKWHNFANNKVGETVIISDGTDVEKIGEIIKKNKYSYTLIDTCFINPIDADMLNKVLSKSKNIFIYNSLVDNKIYKAISLSKTKAKISVLNKTDIKSLFKQIEKEINA